MKLLPLFLLTCIHLTFAQSPQTARLKRDLVQATNDTSRVLRMSDISASYRLSRFDSSMWYGQQGLELARKIHYKKGEGRCLTNISRILGEGGNTPLALKWNLEALQLNAESHDWYGQVQTLNSMGLMFVILENHPEGRSYFFQARRLYDEKKVTDDYGLIVLLLNVGMSYAKTNQLDSADVFISDSYAMLKKSTQIQTNTRGNPTCFVVREKARLLELLGHREEAMHFYRESVTAGLAENDLRSLSISYQFISDWFRQINQNDSAIAYATRALQISESLPLPYSVLNSSKSLTDLYGTRRIKDSVVKYMALSIGAKDSLFNPQRIRQLETVNFTEQQRLRKVEQEHEQFNNKVKVYGLLSGVAILLLGSFVLWRSNRQQKLANTLLKQQQDQITKTLTELKATQSQLIQSEKMASLGELTAGIAHEIQNPLNFVNNFSEVNTELIDELAQEAAKGNLQEVKNLAKDIKDNEEKINHHGKRADAIVKGMLQHSRSSSGVKEPTDINALADEYFRLAYHGLRAKDKSFNATMKTDFDASIGGINIVPQDIGRALLNLITNAFYAVTEKNKQSSDQYEPTVSLSTKKSANKILITVRDNGNGIPRNVVAKIFQPFFTTKPTGQGTGLGLSLSYDIVKAHGGELRVETKEGEGSEFVIQLNV